MGIPPGRGSRVNDLTIERMFVEVAKRYGSSIAIQDTHHALTYQEVHDLARHLAGALTQEGSDRAPVPLLVGHNAQAIIASLGTLFAGRPYSFLPTGSPRLEQEAILYDLGATVLLTDSRHLPIATALAGQRLQVINLNDLSRFAPMMEEPSVNQASDPAVIYYTSGSTGRPKGVVRLHQTILNRLLVDADIYPAGPSDNLGLIRSLNFGATSATVYEALLNGGTLHLADPKEMSSLALAEWLVDRRVSSFRIPTALLRQMLDLLPPEVCFKDMRYCRPAGRLLWTDVHRLWRHLPDGCRLGHGLASTEGSLITHFELNRDDAGSGEVVPVGYPVRDVSIHLLDEGGQPVPTRTIGEIVVSSPGVAPGYWGQDRPTGKIRLDPTSPDRFLLATGDLGRLREDGVLEYLGRKDAQVKVRGFRVEMEAIEAALEQLPGVALAAVRALADDGADYRLIGYVEAQKGVQLSTADLRHRLSKRLPEHMVPSRLIVMPALPVGATGKVNPAALPEPGRERPNLDIPYVAPRTATESSLTALWIEVLGVDEIGIHDNFVELGGQSLLAAQTVARIRNQFRIDLPLGTFLEAATIENVANLLDAVYARRTSLASTS